jgi:hypothetical protein
MIKFQVCLIADSPTDNLQIGIEQYHAISNRADHDDVFPR